MERQLIQITQNMIGNLDDMSETYTLTNVASNVVLWDLYSVLVLMGLARYSILTVGKTTEGVLVAFSARSINTSRVLR